MVPKFQYMDQSYRLYVFILSIILLFALTKTIGNFSHNWFDTQKQCLGHGLTIEKNKSDKPYWTGIHRRLTPWINMFGCYSSSVELLPAVVKNTIVLSSVGMCQEICHHGYGGMFAVKMNTCLCFERDVNIYPLNELPPSACNFKCEDNSDDVYPGDCGGESAYNIYGNQGGHYTHYNVIFRLSMKKRSFGKLFSVVFKSVERCLSLQCSKYDNRFIPQKCSESLSSVCENMRRPDFGYANSWNDSMEQCKNSQPPYYLLGDVRLNNPDHACISLNYQFPLVWIGVVRQVYTSIDKGWEIKEDKRETFLKCQMCTIQKCQFRGCSDSFHGSIFCKSIPDNSTVQITENLTTLQLFAPPSTTEKYDEDLLALTHDTLQISGASDDLVFKISLPLTGGFITLLVCVVGVVLYKRRGKMMKTKRTTKADVKFEHEIKVYTELDFVQSNPSFALDHCYQKISKSGNSLNDSPYNNSERSVNGHLEDKQEQETEGNTIYQNA